jgi:RHS repeat-associated protein
MYRPNALLSNYLYELSDHLGNIRAVIGEDIELEYLATMETERDETSDFTINNRIPTAKFINHTEEVVTVDGMNEEIADPNEVVRMNNAMQGTQTAIGATFKANVYPGDKIKMEVFAKYANFEKNNLDILPTIVSYLESSFGLPTTPDGPIHIFDFMNDPWFASLPPWDDVTDDQPRAFLNYIVLDDNFQLQDFDVVQVGDEAEIPSDAAAALIHQHQKLEMEVAIEKQGTIYVYLSVDDRQNMDVYFDDLKVTHALNDIVTGGDYYPFGSVMTGREITRDDYRFGYQGQFSEKDEETGWNAFEARNYDPVIRRWMIPDPAKQHWSPYLAFSNNPINHVDPDGQWDFGQKVANWFRFGEFLTNTQFDAKYSERINVFIWEKGHGKDVGHTAVEVDGVVFGYYPTDENGNGGYDMGELFSSTGELHIDDRAIFDRLYAGDKINSYSIKVTPAQKATVLSGFKNVELKPGTYSLINQQCTSTAMRVMGDANIKLTDVGGGLDRTLIGIAPKAFEYMLNNSLNSFLVDSKTSFTVSP